MTCPCRICFSRVTRFSVRQYFEAGFYPSGKASKDGEFKQDLWGSTVKAVLIAGAAPLADTLTGGRFDTSEGYGSLILSKVLPFKDDNQIDLQVTQVDPNYRTSAVYISFACLVLFFRVLCNRTTSFDEKCNFTG